MLDDESQPFCHFFVRDLKSKSKPLSFIRDIVKDQLKGGKLTGQQYQKSVSSVYDYLLLFGDFISPSLRLSIL